MSEREELRARPKAAQAAPPQGLRQDEHATRVLACCDGRSDVAAMSRQLSLSPEQVWAALDRLADAGLLVERASPPSATAALAMGALMGSLPGEPMSAPMSAPMSRRDALGALSTGLLAGGALLSAGLTWPTLAYAQEDALGKDPALAPVTPTPEEAQALAQEVTLDGTVETSQRRVQERQLKAQHAERRVKEQDAKHKEAVRCQERHTKARSKEASSSSCAQDAKRLQEEHQKAQQDVRQKRQAEQSAKREHQSLVKRRAEEDAKAKERERHMKKKVGDGDRRLEQEKDAKRGVDDR